MRVKRIYEAPSADDGYRVLVDRLWPRGLKKEDAVLDRWLKEVAPSTALRRWFHRDPDRFEEFRDRYRAELESNDAVSVLEEARRDRPVTLLYASKNVHRNHALVLKDFLDRR